jgi:Family of unknown function (DUF6338)
MPSTVEALGVIVAALLPGALYVWAFERVVGRWGVGFSDRFLRFVGVSAAFHALAAPATYNIWFDYLRPEAQQGANELPWWLWLVALGYVALPTAAGYFVGWRYRGGGEWTRAMVGGTAPPTAWDDIFSRRPACHVLMRLKSGEWIGGEYAAGSYAGGHPEPADLYLSAEVLVDQEQGNFVLDADRKPVQTGYGVLVEWADVEYLEIAQVAETQETEQAEGTEASDG